ncbi:MAG: DUF4250 domain-containing protein [Clostridia bacterium]|nr:DUF4250 domain-containing protein [Clostridia bacterium]
MMLPRDPVMLLSVINMKLRDRYASLDALCEDMDADRTQITAALGEIGYEYNEETNQFI